MPRKESPVGISKWRSAAGAAGLALAFLAGSAGDAQAQRLGLGAHMVSVSGSDSPALDSSDSSRTRFAGGLIRLHATSSLALEASMDYQSTTNVAETASIRNMPIQISAMLIPVKKTFAPYVLAGVGWYKHRVEALDAGQAVATVYSTDFGYHTGLGAQVKLGKHAAIFADYRYVWVDANGIDGISGALKKAASYTTVVGLLTSLAGGNNEQSSISRGGSMWTGGLTRYF
jgi:opacity protein-like surface antigen